MRVVLRTFPNNTATQQVSVVCASLVSAHARVCARAHTCTGVIAHVTAQRAILQSLETWAQWVVNNQAQSDSQVRAQCVRVCTVCVGCAIIPMFGVCCHALLCSEQR
jgi:hypothetical protein